METRGRALREAGPLAMASGMARRPAGRRPNPVLAPRLGFLWVSPAFPGIPGLFRSFARGKSPGKPGSGARNARSEPAYPGFLGISDRPHGADRCAIRPRAAPATAAVDGGRGRKRQLSSTFVNIRQHAPGRGRGMPRRHAWTFVDICGQKRDMPGATRAAGRPQRAHHRATPRGAGLPAVRRRRSSTAPRAYRVTPDQSSARPRATRSTAWPKAGHGAAFRTEQEHFKRNLRAKVFGPHATRFALTGFPPDRARLENRVH